MADEAVKHNIRAEAYAPKVSFDGTFEQMIAAKRMKERNEEKKKEDE